MAMITACGRTVPLSLTKIALMWFLTVVFGWPGIFISMNHNAIKFVRLLQSCKINYDKYWVHQYNKRSPFFRI